MKPWTICHLTLLLFGIGAVGGVSWLPPLLAAEDTPQDHAPQPSSYTKHTNYTNTVEWSTASESDNFGFDVYRGEQPDGPFHKLTQTPVPGAMNTDETTLYTFTDETVKPDVQYYYYVESISLSGVREKFTSVFKAPVKSSQPQAQPE